MKGRRVNGPVFGMLLAVATLLSGLQSGSAWAVSAEEAIIQRIAPVGDVCLVGDDACAAAAAPVAAGGGARGGEEVYQAVCFGCHGTGAAGAPKLGDAGAWTARLDEKGYDTLVQNAINGINLMPPKGTCVACSDEEIESAVKHIIDNSK